MTRPPAPLGLAIALTLPCVAAEELPPPMAFSQAPVLVAGRLPAPNLFLAVHGSARNSEHLPALKAGLQASFSAGRLTSGRIRLAWQTTSQCEELPDPGELCRGRNGLAVLNDARRPGLEAFIQGLTDEVDRGAGAQSLVRKAEAHLAVGGYVCTPA